ncbi:fimbrial protein [Serratia fonticola]|uniref:fimbrial protein n=1 Tax=Serratia fonticola TaxID=47917 RepID=UPI0015C652D1|nr:fimbrial protein [Serratia fonticola]MBC3378678.1 fimbrial protein [Serratia fonticola]NYA37878.1 fimbrial protein [Serratia fonticola]
MKKNLLVVSALAMAVLSGSAMAANEVQFLGVVSDTTCDITPVVNGSVKNLVQLGTVAKGITGNPVDFTLKADPNAPGCGTADLAGKVATIGWGGPLDTTGLKPQGGLATDAYVLLATKNATTTAVQSITSTHSNADFDAEKLTTDGAQFTAALKGGQVVGDYSSAAAYVVAYK